MWRMEIQPEPVIPDEGRSFRRFLRWRPGAAFASGVLSLLMSACGHYKSDFACKGYPENNACLPTTQVYERRHEQLTHMRSDGEVSTSGAGSSSSTPAADRVSAIAGQTEFQLRQPNVTQPQVLQVWIAPWRDAKNYLHEASLVYVMVEGSDWTYGRRPKSIEKLGGKNTFAPFMSRQTVEAAGHKAGPNGGMPMMAAPQSAAVPAPPPSPTPAPGASSDPSAILRQLQQQMPTLPSQGGAPSSFGGPPAGLDSETIQEQRMERMQEQRERMFQ